MYIRYNLTRHAFDLEKKIIQLNPLQYLADKITVFACFLNLYLIDRDTYPEIIPPIVVQETWILCI